VRLPTGAYECTRIDGRCIGYAATTIGAPDSTRPISFIRDPAVHAPRRKIWDRAFTVPALRAYTPLLRSRCAELLAALAAEAAPEGASAGGHPMPVDAQRWLSLMALDWMGDFAWGGLFHAVAAGKDEVGFGALGARSVQLTDVVGTIPWVGPLFMLLLPARTRALRDAAQEVVNRRMRDGARTRDLFTVLVRARVCTAGGAH
jgi:cytochrome P450